MSFCYPILDQHSFSTFPESIKNNVFIPVIKTLDFHTRGILQNSKKNYTLEFLKKLMFWVRSEVILQKSSLSPTTLVQKQTNVNFAYTWPSNSPMCPFYTPWNGNIRKPKVFWCFRSNFLKFFESLECDY